MRAISKQVKRMPRRLLREIRTPETALGRRLLPLWQLLRAAVGVVRRRGSFGSSETLVAFYDLGQQPITYDFLWFMEAAELARRRLQLKKLCFVFVPTRSWESGSEGVAYYKVVDGAARHQRLYDILIPSARLLQSTNGIILTGSRSEASRLVDQLNGRVFPESYSPEFPGGGWPYYQILMDAARAGEDVAMLEAPIGARNWVKRWRNSYCNNRPIVTITLRYFGYDPERNSNLAAWAAFAVELDQRGYCPVIVPDTHMTLDSLPPSLKGLTVFVEAAWHVHLRAALYEAAYLNLGINTGPMDLCSLNRSCRYIIYKQIVEGDNVGSLEAQLERGIDPRQPFPFATPYQRLVLEPDDLDVIRREFDAMVAKIESDRTEQSTDGEAAA